MNALIGVEQLKKLNKISKIRHNNFIRYKENLKNFWHQKSSLSLISSFGFATFVKNRLEVFKYLRSKNSNKTSNLWKYNQQPFLQKRSFKNNELTNSKKVDKYGIYLPNYANLTLRDIDFVSKVFKKVAKPLSF